MIDLIVKGWKALLHDELFARRLLRGLLIGFAASAAGLTPFLPLWWHKVGVLAAAGIAGVVGGLISVGQKNPTDEQLVAAVDRSLATIGERRVNEPGPTIPAAADPLSNPRPGSP